jgi:hypothetical protein
VSKSSLEPEQVLSLLEQTPARIAVLTADLSEAQLHTSPDPGNDAWSANDVLAHLRSCADMWGGSIMTIIAKDNPTIRVVNPTTWIKQTDYPQQDFLVSLDAFTRQRADLLVALKALPPEAWSRGATVTGAGAVLHRTVLSYAQWLARHERPHVKQIAHIAKTVQMHM